MTDTKFSTKQWQLQRIIKYFKYSLKSLRKFYNSFMKKTLARWGCSWRNCQVVEVINFLKRYQNAVGIFFLILFWVLTRIGQKQDIPVLLLPLHLLLCVLFIYWLFEFTMQIYEKGLLDSIRTLIFWIYLIAIIFLLFYIYRIALPEFINLIL